MGGGKWLADAVSAQSIQVGGTVKKLYSVQMWLEVTSPVLGETDTVAVHMTLFDVENGVSYLIPDTLLPNQGIGDYAYNNPYTLGTQSIIFFSQDGRHIGILTKNFKSEILDGINDSLEYDDTECSLIVIKDWYLDTDSRLVKTNEEVNIITFKPSSYIPAIYPLPSPPSGARLNRFSLYPMIYNQDNQVKYTCVMHRLSWERDSAGSSIATSDLFVVVDLEQNSFFTVLDITQPNTTPLGGGSSVGGGLANSYTLNLATGTEDNGTFLQIFEGGAVSSTYPLGTTQSTLYRDSSIVEVFPLVANLQVGGDPNTQNQVILLNSSTGEYLKSPSDIQDFIFDSFEGSLYGYENIGPAGLSATNAYGNIPDQGSTKFTQYRSSFASIQASKLFNAPSTSLYVTYLIFGALTDGTYSATTYYSYSSSDVFEASHNPISSSLVWMTIPSIGVR